MLLFRMSESDSDTSPEVSWQKLLWSDETNTDACPARKPDAVCRKPATWEKISFPARQ